MSAALWCVCTASFLAAVSDLRTRRIPDALAGALFLCGLILNASAGWQTAAAGLAIVVAVLVAGTVAFSLKLVGGGDVKLVAAAAGTLGYPAGPIFILFTLLAGGAIAVAYATARGRLKATLFNVRAFALPVFAGVQPVPVSDGTPMPYALAIFAGSLCIAGLQPYMQHLRLP